MKPVEQSKLPSHAAISIRSGPNVPSKGSATVEETIDEEDLEAEEEGDGEGLDDEGLKKIAGMLDAGHKEELAKMLEAKVSTALRFALYST